MCDFFSVRQTFHDTMEQLVGEVGRLADTLRLSLAGNFADEESRLPATMQESTVKLLRAAESLNSQLVSLVRLADGLATSVEGDEGGEGSATASSAVTPGVDGEDVEEEYDEDDDRGAMHR